MIALTKISGNVLSPILIGQAYIVSIEASCFGAQSYSLITLTNGDEYAVTQSIDEIVKLIKISL